VPRSDTHTYADADPDANSCTDTLTHTRTNATAKPRQSRQSGQSWLYRQSSVHLCER
jgi:hypothetical protein